MNLIRRIVDAGKQTREDLRKDLKKLREMEKNASYYEYKELRNEEFLTVIFTPIYYLSHLFKG